MTLRIDYSSYLSKIFKARLLHDLERQPLIRATKETSRSTNHLNGNWMVGEGPKKLDLR